MKVLLAITVGVLSGAGFYMMLRRSLVKVILGLALLGHAANLLIFTVGGLSKGRVPLVSDHPADAAEPLADPLPQALILTAIVIGFGLQAFTIVLFKKVYAATGTDDVDRLTSTESV
jgi:multicomponent Na+:H+ antiporter subunit C